MTNFLDRRHSRWPLALGVILLIWAAGLQPAQSQSTGWQPLAESNGVELSFIVHRYGDGENAGVVVRLTNRNPTETSYRFKVVLKSEHRRWTSDIVLGILEPLEVRTGEMSGLWWIPFKDGAPITEVGLRGFRVEVLGNHASNRSEPGG